MKQVILYSVYRDGSLWYRDENGYYHQGLIDELKSDKVIADLSLTISKLYDECEKQTEVLDNEGKLDEMNEVKEQFADKTFPLLEKLKERLNQLNNGSYEIEDWETYQVNDYYQSNKSKRVQTGKAHLQLYSFFSYDYPIYPRYDTDDDEEIYNLNFIFDDEIVKEISEKIDKLYETFETKRGMEKQDVFFKNERKGMKEMIELYKQLRNRLVKINDGSYDIIDEYPLYLLCHYGDVKNIKY